MATNGRLGFASAPPRYSSSFSIRKPATAGRTNSATPAVLAWARWAAPKASLTYRSPSCASARESAASFFSSPARKRVFSRRSSSPSASCRVASTAASVCVSPRKRTVRAGSSSRSRRATGSSEYFASGAPLGPAEVRAEHDARALAEQVLDRRERGADARVVATRRCRRAAR
jgi:hypothetical protein